VVTGRYSQILGSIVIGGYFCSLWHPIRYWSDSSQHRPHDNHFDVWGAAIVSRWRQGGVECKLYIVIIIQFLRFYAVYSLQINTLLCYTLVSALVLGIGIASGHYYWILGAFLGIVLTLLKTWFWEHSQQASFTCVFPASWTEKFGRPRFPAFVARSVSCTVLLPFNTIFVSLMHYTDRKTN